MGSYTLASAPAVEPILPSDLKLHMRVDSEEENTLILAYIRAARIYLEDAKNQQFITATWEYRCEEFPDEFVLNRSPLQSVTSIKYYDTDDVLQTLDSSLYEVDTYSVPGRVRPADGETWPVVDDRYNAITVTFVAGYGTSGSDVPEPTRHAIRLLAAHWFENREATTVNARIDEIPIGVRALMDLDRIGGF